MKSAIIIMAKAPEPGKAKTRLQPRLTPEQAAEFAESLLRDTINKAAGQQNCLIIAYSPSDRGEFFDEFTRHNLLITPQKGLDLGERIFNAFDFAFSNGLDSVVMIGTDSPTFPAEFIDEAFERLGESDVVLGESEDGGFYLIGLRSLKKEIFENVRWGSSHAYRKTAENIQKSGLKLSRLPIWYDVDRPADLERLRHELREVPILAPETAAWLKKAI